MANVTLTVDGMSCGGCVRHVTEALGRLQGVQVKTVVVGSAEVDYDRAKTGPEAIVAALAEAGYPAKLATEPAGRGHCGGGGACCAG